MRLKYVFCTLLLLVSSFIKAQSNIYDIHKEGEDLVITTNGRDIILRKVLNGNVGAEFFLSDKKNFHIVYHYYGSYTKSMIVYSLYLEENAIGVKHVLHLNYDDREALPFGWIYYCTDKISVQDFNYDSLTSIKSQQSYDIYEIKEYSRSTLVFSDKNKAYSKAVKSRDKILLSLPLFFQDGSIIGNSEFIYNAQEWHDLNMNFSVDNFNIDYFKSTMTVDKKNVVSLNDIAYYLGKTKNYYISYMILENILTVYPKRMVAYINLGDAYWGYKKKEKAKKAYQQYITLMTKSGKTSLIPKRVYERVK
ncbi:hypothetical protein K5X82_08855 [Halosquirtibacter xylanolyticus]|uniref:hypothetical protein n=1 Tax=Halosquirtibacter xylanolyticus TaxID=3374599 RepID=UPI0037486595|nr:hypothetical protein K5X82_08855 [Prolixibacteraceae bacterium]